MNPKKFSPIKVIGFDLDETLWPLNPTITIATQKTEAFLLQCVPDLPSTSLVLNDKKKQAEIVSHFKYNITQRRLHLMHQLLIEAGVENKSAQAISEEALALFLDLRHQLHYFDGVIDGLKLLKKNYALASISNGNARISKLGDLNALFDFSINAEDINSSKPDPDLFLTTLKYFKCDPSEMIYIGDSLEHDVFGAEALGIHSIWMNWKQREPSQSGVKHEANDFNELIKIINKIDSRS